MKTRYVYGTFCTVVILWVILGFLIYLKCKSTGFEHPGQFGDTFGTLNCLFSGLAFAGVILTMLIHDKERKRDAIVDQFFKMLDYHQNNINNIVTTEIRIPASEPSSKQLGSDNDKIIKLVTNDAKEIKGRKAFVEYKMQIKHLLRLVKEINQENNYNYSNLQIADITYCIFFYGANKEWKDFMTKYLNEYNEPSTLVDQILAKIAANPKYALGRTNQTDLSTYFRNIYNAIKLIDETELLDPKEKEQYIKILRSQLSNPELYVLLFNVLSRFGKNWKEHKYVTTYNLFDNMPEGYCDGYEPKAFFVNNQQVS